MAAPRFRVRSRLSSVTTSSKFTSALRRAELSAFVGKITLAPGVSRTTESREPIQHDASVVFRFAPFAPARALARRFRDSFGRGASDGARGGDQLLVTPIRVEFR